MKFIGIMLAGLLAASAAQAETFFSSSGSNTLNATASEATSFAGAGTGQFFRVSFLNAASGFVGFSATPYSATAATNPVYIPPSTAVFIDGKRREVIIHYVSQGGGTVIVEEVQASK
jgi:hypothetical protein